ncbi:MULTISPECIES: BglG family transcription antiterminator [Paenibacillus]|uniref:BglG family transcription antiterminator n=1 Tax=Paenibacillus TaxID=44249 RepID=UPI0004B9D98D|nr:BglG family transcription antiterminator [Paenibacillus sp. IHBB 10380]
MSILELLQQTADYVPIQEVMDTFNISKRTVYYDLDKINGWLRFQQLPPVAYVRGTGYLLPQETRLELPKRMKDVPATHYYLSREERKAWLGLHLISRSEPMYLHHMEELLQVSRGTAHSELKELRSELRRFCLQIVFERKRGYTVQGNEKDVRAAISSFLNDLLPSVSTEGIRVRIEQLMTEDLFSASAMMLETEQWSTVYDMIASGERLIGMELSDETIAHLTSRLILYASRFLQGHPVKLDDEEKSALQQVPQYRAAQEIAGRLGSLAGAALPEDEVCYITIQLLTGKVNKLEVEPDSQEARRVQEAVRLMIEAFEHQGCVHFRNRAELEKPLVLHVKSLYYRAKYGIPADNPLAETIMVKYREIFELTKQSAQPLEGLLGRPLSEHEISYLTMHFGGWIRSQDIVLSPRKTAVIVCVNGISASRLLKVQIEQLLPSVDLVAILSLRQYETFERSVDFVFSTVPLHGSKVPVFTVPAVLNDTEKVHLLNQLTPYIKGNGGPLPGPSAQAIVDLVGKHVEIPDKALLLEEIQRYLTAAKSIAPADYKPTLAELLPASRIQILDSVSDWRSAIRTAADPLVKEGCIQTQYVQAMIDNVERYGPYIVTAPGIAIAHAKPEDGAFRHAMALISIRSGVPFSDESRHLVHGLFVMVSADGESHLKALSQLTHLLRDDGNRILMGQADSKEDVLQLIRKYSTTSEE